MSDETVSQEKSLEKQHELIVVYWALWNTTEKPKLMLKMLAVEIALLKTFSFASLFFVCKPTKVF